MAQQHYTGLPPPPDMLSKEKRDLIHIQTTSLPAFANPASGPRPPLQRHVSSNTFKNRYRHAVSRFWIWEITCSIMALILLAAIMALLIYYNNKPVSMWRLTWNINSVVALMVTVMKGAMLIPVAQCLGQLKWLWFKRQQRINDLDMFDSASRGVLGSARLVVKLRFWHLATIGAIITIATLSIDTLTQSVITLRSDLTLVPGTPLIPKTNSFVDYQRLTTGDELGDQWAPINVITALNQGYSWVSALNLSSSDGALFKVPVSDCPTGTCFFEAYQTLGIDTQCVDRTHETTTEDGLFWELGADHAFNATIEVISAQNASIYPPPVNSSYSAFGPLISRTVLWFNDTTETDQPPSAFECILYWTVTTYSANYTDNVLIETVLTDADGEYKVWSNVSEEAYTRPYQTEPIYIKVDECWTNNTLVTDPENEPRCTFWVGPTAQLGLQNVIAERWLGMNDYQAHEPGTISWSNASPFIMNMFKIWGPDRSLLLEYTELTFGQLSASVTSAIRQIEKGDSFENNNWLSQSRGMMYERENYFDVRWRWMALPIFLVVCSCLFLVLTIATHETRMAWKTSSLPLVYHGLAGADRASMGEPLMFADMQDSADQARVLLTDTPEGLRLMRTT